MLIIARRRGESVQIGPDIVVTVVAADGGYAKLGVEAPKDVRIIRQDAVKKDPKTEGAEPQRDGADRS